MFLNRLCNFLETIEFQNTDINILHNDWIDDEKPIITKIINIYNSNKKDVNTNDNNIKKININELLERTQIPQRTPEWYEIMKRTLSASEIGYIFTKSSRKHIISSKLFSENNFRDSPIESSIMSATDWGIRFEPIVKQIYSDKYSASLKELGKLFDLSDPRYCASPDGLVYESPAKQGRLIEIKCPVTRKLQDMIPKQYYNQIQMQLHITGITICDYIEARFDSSYSKKLECPSDCLYKGNIYLIYNQKDCINKYEYSPLNNSDWIPLLQPNEIIIEKIPWRLYNWKEVTVHYDNQWWNNIKPHVDLFWSEYMHAKENPVEFIGEKGKNTKKDTCLIRLPTQLKFDVEK